jgi:general secretion pathway protein A
MYERFFGLRERPFELTSDPRYLVLTDPHREALSNIEYGIASRKGITLIVGAAGSGKTTVIWTAIERQPASGLCVHLHNPALTRPEFVEMLAARFGLGEGARKSKTVLLLELEAFLHRRYMASEPTVLIVDEAQSLPVNLLEEIRLLASIETNNERLLSVVLAGQPDFVSQLEDPSLSQLKQQVALWCELRPLTLQETAAYMLSRIRSAGGIAGQAFTADAVRLIHAVSGGVPRIINVLADNALLTGLAEATRPVNSQIVHAVCSDFRIREQPQFAEADARTMLSQPSTSASPGNNGSPVAANASLPDASSVASVMEPKRPIFSRMFRRYFLG